MADYEDVHTFFNAWIATVEKTILDPAATESAAAYDPFASLPGQYFTAYRGDGAAEGRSDRERAIRWVIELLIVTGSSALKGTFGDGCQVWCLASIVVRGVRNLTY